MSHLLMLHVMGRSEGRCGELGSARMVCVNVCSHTEDTQLRPLRAPDSLSSSKAWRKGSASIRLLDTHPYLLAGGVQ